MQARQIEVQRGQIVVAEIEMQKIRQIAEHVGVPKLRDVVLLQVKLYELREITENIWTKYTK